ncbi:MAG: hypothetical protein ABIN48_02645 [Ginsengibacter sp.]
MKSILIISTIIISSNICFGQNDTIPATEESTPKKSTLTLGTVYSNNASYYGQRSEEKTPYIAAAASYRLKSGFYFTGQTFKLLSEKTSDVSAVSLGAGININMGENFSTDISYSHSFFPAHSPLLQAGNTDNASLTFAHNGWFKTSLTGDYAFGKAEDIFTTGEISKDISLFSIGKKDIVSFSPSANIVAGTQHFYQTYITEKKTRDSLFGVITGPIFGTPPPQTETKQVHKTSFDILSYNVRLPISYSRAHYMIEAAAQLSFLSEHVDTKNEKMNSFLTFSFYYQF